MAITTTLTTRGVRANKARFVLTAVAVIVGVAFVSGSFLLTSSLKGVFGDLSEQIARGTDVQVRTKVAFGQSGTGNPVPADLEAQVAAVPGVAAANGTVQAPGVTILDADGKAMIPNGPTFAVSFTDDGEGSAKIAEGRFPTAPNEIALDKGSFDKSDYAIGDTAELLTPTGRESFTLVGAFRFGDSNNLGGAYLVALDKATASAKFASGGYTTIDVRAAEGVTDSELAQRVQASVGTQYEAIDNETLVAETKDSFNSFIDQFGTALLVFAFIALFVSAFIISNTFAILAQQRVRELAMLRAIGASRKQITRMMIGEALVIGAISSVVGFGAGYLVATGIKALLALAGADLPGGIAFSYQALVAALIVGFVVTLISAVAPARRASTVPPVAAISGNHSFEVGNAARRLVLSGVAAAVGLALLSYGLFATPGGTSTTLITAGLGALVLFLGVAGLSRLIARPLVLALGRAFWAVVAVVARVFRRPHREVAARLARENAARQPRRTAATASALMIGLALVSAVGVLGESLKTTFRGQLDELVTADLFITGKNFTGLTPAVLEDVRTVPGVGAVTGIQAGVVQIGGETKDVSAADPDALGELIEIGVQSGSLADLRGDTVFVQSDPAEDLGLGVGSKVDITFPSTGTKTFTVAGTYDDGTLIGNWLVSSATYNENFTADPSLFFVAADYAPGADAGAAQVAVRDLVDARYPAVEVQDRAQFQRAQENQLNIMLAVINALLGLAVIIAMIGIANTLALSVYERTREIGLLRAVGMTRAQVKRNVRWEAALVAVFGAIIGVGLGVLIGLLVTRALPASVISTVKVPFTQLLLYIAAALVAGVLAARKPAKRAAKMDVLTAIAHA